MFDTYNIKSMAKNASSYEKIGTVPIFLNAKVLELDDNSFLNTLIFDGIGIPRFFALYLRLLGRIGHESCS